MESNRRIILIIPLMIYLSFSIFGYAYAVDNNCRITAVHILELRTIFGCIEERLDALENAPTGSESTICGNVGTGILIHVSGSNCNAKSLVGSGDINITNSSNTITIDYNGTASGESTNCNNLGTGNPIHKSGTNCSAFSLIAGNDITITNTTDDYTIASTATEESTTCNNVGTGSQLCSGGNVNVDTLIAGDDITITDTTDDWTIATLRKGQVVAHVWQSITKTNIGTGYIDVYATLWDNEEQTVIDFTNISDCAIAYMWDYVGTGSQQLRWVDPASNVLYETPTFTSDRNPHTSSLGNGWSGWFTKPVGISGILPIEQQGKSTVAGDDPIGKGYVILCR